MIVIVIVDSIRIAQFFHCRYAFDNFLFCHPLLITHKIYVWYIYLLIYHKNATIHAG